MASNRSRLIGLIHMQKNAASLSDDEYRLIIAGATGKESCSVCDMKELYSVFHDMNAVLENKGHRPFYFHKVNNSNTKPSVKDAVVSRCKKLFGDNWNDRLQGFLNRMGKKSLFNCNDKEVRQIMGWLSTLERKQKNG